MRIEIGDLKEQIKGINKVLTGYKADNNIIIEKMNELQKLILQNSEVAKHF